ncbi:MAG: hypothetical protein GF398_11760 [Chitinivibrionales bacterium]|nr:hypothetical protein [Chitinivibrionales bacterium]
MSAELVYLVFDGSAIVLLLLLSYLSRRLGEALKIPPYYRILFISVALILLVMITEIISIAYQTHLTAAIALIIIKCIAGWAALFTCLRYWKWLFTEYLKR